MSIVDTPPMRIAMYSTIWHPVVGGLVNVIRDLGEEFAARGHEVILITTMPHSGAEPHGFRVLRRPGFRKTRAQIRASDVLLQFNFGLKLVPAWVGTGTPMVVSHQSAPGREQGLLGHLKIMLANWFAYNVGCGTHFSRYYHHYTPIPNAFDHRMFRRIPGLSRTRQLCFVGRLVSDKGVDILLHALRLLCDTGLRPNLTIIGPGPERKNLEEVSVKLGLSDQVSFVGVLEGDALVRELNRHAILVVPSRWEEPFGIVALEGIACGCLVIGSQGGGLAEAIGPCGLTFRNGDPKALAERLMWALQHREEWAPFLAAAPQHLQRFHRDAVAGLYVEALHAATGCRMGRAGVAKAPNSDEEDRGNWT